MKQQNTQKIRSVPAMMFMQHEQKQEHSKSSAVDLIFQHPADLTSCRHYWPKTCCRQSRCRQTPCRQSSCRQKHPADKTCCRRKIMSARILHVVCRKIMSVGCFGSCDVPIFDWHLSQVHDGGRHPPGPTTSKLKGTEHGGTLPASWNTINCSRLE